MTVSEAKKILAILKSAYPNSYKGMTKDTAMATVNVWATQFSDIPVQVVYLAVTKLISSNVFPPSIAEVREKMKSLYWEAIEMIGLHDSGQFPLDDKTLATTGAILQATEAFRMDNVEPSLSSLISASQYLKIEDEAKKKMLLASED